MSKLGALRGSAKAPAAIFSNTVSPEISNILNRMAEGKSSRTFPPRKKWVPSRFRLKAGETKRLIILDEKISYAQAEHSVKDREGKWATERCISATDACPICSLPKHNPADKILLTVLDLTPWSYEKDGKTIEKEFTKRELAIGTKQLPIFQNLAAMQGLRGLVLDMTRGQDPLEAGIGVPSFIQKLTEEELLEMFGHDEISNEEGKVIKEANADITPFDYEKIHTPPTRAELAQKYGIAPRPGSIEERQQEEEKENTDVAPWDEQEQTVLLDLNELPDVD